MRILKNFIKKVLGIKPSRHKDQIKEINKDYLMHNFFQILVKLKFEPLHIIDIGANKGTWTNLALKYFPNSKYTLIEPQKDLERFFANTISQNSNITWLTLGAGSEDGILPLTEHERDDSFSFMYSKEEAKNLGRNQIEVEVKTLNSILNNYDLMTPDIIKIDAEGFDLEVLKGATNCFGKTEVILVEAGVMNKIFNNNVLNIIDFMDKVGYRLFDITDLNRTSKDNTLWLIELAFIRKDGFLDKSVTSYA